MNLKLLIVLFAICFCQVIIFETTITLQHAFAALAEHGKVKTVQIVNGW